MINQRRTQPKPQAIRVTLQFEVRLSGAQAEMLKFFAGQAPEPTGATEPTVRALRERQLLDYDPENQRVKITPLGWRVLDRLNHGPMILAHRRETG